MDEILRSYLSQPPLPRLKAPQAHPQEPSQLTLAMTVRGLAANPHDRQLLKLATQLSQTLAGMEVNLAPENRFAATALGRQLEEMLLGVVAKLFPAASRNASPAGPARETSPREVPNITKLMYAQSADSRPRADSAATDATVLPGETCGGIVGVSDGVMHDKEQEKKFYAHQRAAELRAHCLARAGGAPSEVIG
jgi:hypothetical protein